MPDEKNEELADEEQVPDTPLHAHADDRHEDVVGEPEPEVREEGDLDRGVGNPVGDDEDDDGDDSEE